MANERFSIVEHLDWTAGKVSIYGKLYSLFDNLTDSRTQYETELSNIESGTFDASAVNLNFNDSDSDVLYGNNKTIRVFFEEMPVLGVTPGKYNQILTSTSVQGDPLNENIANLTDATNGNYLKTWEPHINLKKNQEIGVYISPLVDMRTPIKDFVNIFDPGSSTSNVYYRSTINPPKATPDYIIEPEATTSQSFLIPDKYGWRPDSFNHPLQENLVHTWPLHYEDTYLDDVQSGRHISISSNLITLRKQTDLTEWISSISSLATINSMITEASISGNSLKHIMDYHWIVNKTFNTSIKKFEVSSTYDSNFPINSSLNPFDALGLDLMKTYIPKPQEIEDLVIKMFNLQYPDLNGHLLNYYDNVGDNLDQYFIFNDVFNMYKPTMEIHKLDLSSYNTTEFYSIYDSGGTSTSTTLPNEYTETFRYGDVKEYVEYLSKLYEIKGLDNLDDDDYVSLPKSFIRSPEIDLPTNVTISPTNPPNLKLKQYENNILTGFLDIGSFEREPLSTGDGNLSIAFSVRNLDGGTIMSTGAEIDGETGIYISIDKEANSSTKPISPFEYNLHIEIKSTNYEYKFAQNLNYFESEEYHNFGFGLFRPVASMQRPITLNYSYDSSLYNEVENILTDISNPIADGNPLSTSTWEKYYTDVSGIKNLNSKFKSAYTPTVSHPYIDNGAIPPSGINPYIEKTKTYNWSDFNWTNILISKRESVEYVKVPINGTDKNTWENIFDENGNKITNYLDAKIWLLNNFEDAINEVGGWSGNISTRPLEFQKGLLLDDINELQLQKNSTNDGLNILNLNLRYYDDTQKLFNINFDSSVLNNNDIGTGTENVNLFVQLGVNGEILQIHLTTSDTVTDCIKIGSFKPVTDKDVYIFDFTQSLDICYGVPNNFVDVFASYKNDSDEIKYVYLGRTFGQRKDYEEGSNTNLYIGRANLSSKPYFKGHLKDFGIWYKYLTPISSNITELDSDTTPITTYNVIDHIWTHGDSGVHNIEYNGNSIRLSSNGGFELTSGSLEFTSVIDKVMYSNVYYTLNYNRTQYLSDLALNVQTTKWTKYPFKISYNTDNNYPSLTWYNRGKNDFSSTAIPKEKVVQNKGYRSWQAKVLLKL